MCLSIRKYRSAVPCSTGFTLIELLITVAVLAVLAAIAVPSYRAYVQRGYMTEAKVNLVNLSMLLDEYKAVNDTYCPPSTACTNTATTYRYTENDDGTVATDQIDWIPFHPKQAISGKAVRYRYEVDVGTAQLGPGLPTLPAYTLRAIPDTSRGAKPGTFVLGHEGEKTFDGNAGWDAR